MNTNYEAMAGKLNEFNAKNVQDVMALGEKTMERTQKLSQISFDMTKSLMTEVNDTFSKVMNAKDPQAMISIAQENSMEAINSKIVAHQQAMSKVLREAAEEMTEMNEVSMEQMKTSVNDWVKSLAANAPAGSEAFVTAIKTSVESTLQGVNKMQAAAKEVATNVEKTTDQAVEAMKGQVAKAKQATTKMARTSARRSA